jgi:hypothetical protein
MPGHGLYSMNCQPQKTKSKFADFPDKELGLFFGAHYNQKYQVKNLKKE